MYAKTSDTTHPSDIIPFDDSKVQQLMANDEEDINMLFMSNETVIFKDCNGINQETTYLGPNLSDGILKHRFELGMTLNLLLMGSFSLL